jgi:hypothetical protein
MDLNQSKDPLEYILMRNKQMSCGPCWNNFKTYLHGTREN